MSNGNRSESSVGIVALLISMAWALAVWRQPTVTVMDALTCEHRASLPIVQDLVGPCQIDDRLLGEQENGRTAQALGAETAQINRRFWIYQHLVALRGALFGAVYLAGIPLLIAAWQVGKARQRAAFRRGEVPSPSWQSAGWTVAALGLIVPSVGPAPFALVTSVVSFGWLGSAGAMVSACGAYLLGRHSRRG